MGCSASCLEGALRFLDNDGTVGSLGVPGDELARKSADMEDAALDLPSAEHAGVEESALALPLKEVLAELFDEA